MGAGPPRQRPGRRYLVGTPKGALRRWARQVAEAHDWRTVRDGVEAKTCPGPEGTETFLLVRSVERCEKEQAIHVRFAQRIEAGLARLAHRLTRARRPLDRGRLEWQVGRLLAHNARAAGPLRHRPRRGSGDPRRGTPDLERPPRVG